MTLFPPFDEPEIYGPRCHNTLNEGAGASPTFISSSKINTNEPHSARVWNYLLGEDEYYPVDRKAGDAIAETIPGIVGAARHNQAFLGRAVRYLVGEGVTQFLDLGMGLPTRNNTHEVAQREDPSSRVVYVDNDPLVLAHARALLASGPQGTCDYIDADIRDTRALLCQAARTLSFDRPVAVMMLGILNHLVEDDEAHRVVDALVEAMAPGSFLVVAHPTAAVDGGAMHQAMQLVMNMGGAPVKVRSPEEIAGFFAGVELLEPGVVSCSRWWPEVKPFGEPEEVSQFCGVGRKPGLHTDLTGPDLGCAS